MGSEYLVNVSVAWLRVSFPLARGLCRGRPQGAWRCRWHAESLCGGRLPWREEDHPGVNIG